MPTTTKQLAIKAISLLILVGPVTSWANTINPFSIERSCEGLKQNLKSGDLIFIQIDNIVYRKLVAEITSSWASHVGIAFKKANGDWIVSESTTMRSKETELCKYLKRTKGTRFEVRRLKSGISQQQSLSLYQSAQDRMRIWYDTGFNYDEKGTSFCSKFVYDIYLESLGIELGKIETFGEIRDRKLKEDPDYDYSFVYLWFFRLKIPWERRTVTPESQRIDSDLITVAESH